MGSIGKWDKRKYETLHKWGKPVLTGSGEAGAFDEWAVDCPFVFQHGDLFHMMYVGFNGVGYQTGLATSEDLLSWTPKGVILKRGEGNGWDSRNTAGTWLLRENALDGPPILKKVDGRYWLAYHTYPEDGYEEGPGKIGLAWTDDETLMTWNRLPEPILVPEDGEAWECGGLYKECLLEHDGKFYLFYNAKNQGEPWKEQTGLAVSNDLLNWERVDTNPLLRTSPDGWDSLFVSDPCVLQDGEKWVMYFFGYDGKHAQEGIAFSKDLLNWEKAAEPIIGVGGKGDLDSIHAHKPSVVMHEGTLYHFYCACRPYQAGDAARNSHEYRTITVATSRPVLV